MLTSHRVRDIEVCAWLSDYTMSTHKIVMLGITYSAAYNAKLWDAWMPIGGQADILSIGDGTEDSANSTVST